MLSKENIKKYYNVWNDLPFLFKFINGALLLSQAMSIASIGERVYEFKGFIIHGIKFYHEMTAPIIHVFNLLGLQFFDRQLFDSVIWISLYIAITFKASKYIPDKKYLGTTITGLFFSLIIVLVIIKLDPSAVNSLNVFSGILFMVTYFSFVSKSWLPLFFFFLPFVLVSCISVISEALVRV